MQNGLHLTSIYTNKPTRETH